MSEHWHVVEAGEGHWQLTSGGSSFNFKSREDAEVRLAKWAANGTCVECGDVLNDEWAEPYHTRVLTRQLCFNCLFWQEMVEGEQGVRIDGDHYQIAPETDSSYFRGFGGRRFVIRFDDERLVTTTNLWSQGKIPAHFRERLPNNAVFVRDEVRA